MMFTNLQGQIPLSVKKHPHRIQSLLDSMHAVNNKLVEAHLYQGLRSNRDNILVVQSPCGTTHISSKLVITLADK
jgi:cephalosporin hydroxylase